MIRPNAYTEPLWPLGVRFRPETLPVPTLEPLTKLPRDTLKLDPDQRARLLEVRQARVDARLAAQSAWDEMEDDR